MTNPPSDPAFTELDTRAFDTYYAGVELEIAITVYIKTAQIFLKKIKERLDNLTRYLKENDVKQAKVIAHQLKGSLLSLGGNNLANTFRTIETDIETVPCSQHLALLEGKLTKMDQFTTELVSWIEQLEKKLKSL